MAQRGDRTRDVALWPAQHRGGHNLRVRQALGVDCSFWGAGLISGE